MSGRLVVVIGAGASHDCASDPAKRREDRRPPLVKDLFGKDFDYLLGRYPLAQAAADEIRQAIDPESKDALQLEDYLREQMRDSTDSYTSLRYRQIPLYLQDLLFAVGNVTGEGYTTEPSNYNALNNAVLKLDDVCTSRSTTTRCSTTGSSTIGSLRLSTRMSLRIQVSLS
jgi:hypothetical protein